MIRNFNEKDIDKIMQIWIDTNIRAHKFIKESYWKDNFEIVKSILPTAEIYVYVSEEYEDIKGFIGLNNNYIEGIFVLEEEQSKGIGKQLLDYAKKIKNKLNLNVYKNNKRAIEFYKREGFIVKLENIEETTGEYEYLMEWKNS